MKYFLKFIPWVLAGLAVYLLIEQISKPKDTITIYKTHWVEVPKIIGNPDPVILPTPLSNPKRPQIDSTWYKKYIGLKDSISKDSMLRSAITINTYNHVFSDTIVDISIKAKVRGTLLELDPEYTIHSFSFPEVVDLEVPVPSDKFDLAIETEIGSNQFFNSNPNTPGLIIKTGVDIRLGKIKLGTSYDTNETIWLKVGYLLF